MTKIFKLIQHYCRYHHFLSYRWSQWTRVEVSLTEKLYWGERERDFLIFSNCANAQVLFSGATVCSLSDWERHVCVWLPYHLGLLFASVSADWAFLPVSLPELMMNYKRGLLSLRIQMFQRTRTHTLPLVRLDAVLAILLLEYEDLLCKLNEKTGAN